MATYSKAQVKAAVKAALEQCRPVGSYLLFAGKTLPTGYLLCNGAAVSRTTYAALFAVIGTTYGAGDGSTTFNLPNLDGRVLQGVNDLTKVGTYLESGLPNITGFIQFLVSTRNDDLRNDWNGCFVWGGYSASSQLTRTAGNNSFNPYLDASKSNAIYGSSSTVQNPALRTLVAIRY